jgi:HEPN domain-containing protein
MNRNDLVDLAKIRLKEARVLLKNGNYDGAYYLCGYVVECGLKACIAKQTKKYDFPDKTTVKRSYNHDLTKLLGTAGLENPKKDERMRNLNLALNWTIVKDWRAGSRYEKHARKETEDLYSAIVNRNDGVLKWIRQYW